MLCDPNWTRIMLLPKKPTPESPPGRGGLKLAGSIILRPHPNPLPQGGARKIYPKKLPDGEGTLSGLFTWRHALTFPYTTAIGLPGEPVAPLSRRGLKI